jgi:site-specific recombinase XerD
VNHTRSQLTKYRITFVRTKGKITAVFQSAKSFTKKSLHWKTSSSFLTAISSFYLVWEAGQLPHILRHTFAAHFTMSGGNILALQKILGQHDIKMTMSFAHLSPYHLQTALRFNPLEIMVQIPIDATFVRT